MSSDDSSAPPSCKVKSVEQNNVLRIASLQESPFSIKSPVPKYQASFKFSAGKLWQELIQAAEAFLASPQFEELDTGHEILNFVFGVNFNTPYGIFEFEPVDGLANYEQDSTKRWFDSTLSKEKFSEGLKYSPKWESGGWYSANPKVMSIESCSIVSVTMSFGNTILASFKF